TDMNDVGCDSPTDTDEFNAVCGNNRKETGEACDGTDLGGSTCSSQGYDGGTLKCKSDCSAYDTSGCWTNSCSDTDGGIYYKTSGTVSGRNNGNSYSYSDSCSNSTLSEWYCGGTNAYSTSLNCASNYTGCSNGACY
ncbi:MAG: hypothetical protein AABW87_03750, partial [Nanoarchaeota archaeon]